MLERTTRNLDPALRSSAWRPRRKINSKRALHTSFWNRSWDDGAIDLDLPAWWIATLNALFVPGGARLSRNQLLEKLVGRIRQRAGCKFILGYLHDPVPRSLHIRPLPSSLYNHGAARRTVERTAHARHFFASHIQTRPADISHEPSTTPLDLPILGYPHGIAPVRQNDAFQTSTPGRPPPAPSIPQQAELDARGDTGVVKEHGLVQCDDETTTVSHTVMQHDGKASPKLSRMSSDEAWGHLQAIPPEDWTVEGATETMRTFALKSAKVTEQALVDSRRMIELYHQVFSDQTNPEAMHLMIKALLMTEEFDEAREMHRKAMQYRPAGFDATADLVSHALTTARFLEVFQIWRNRVCNGQTFQTQDAWYAWEDACSKRIAQIPGIQQNICAAVQCAASSHQNAKVPRSFVQTVLKSFFKHSIPVASGELEKLSRALKTLELTSVSFYEKACHAMSSLEKPKHQVKDLTLQYYHMFRQDHCFAPKATLTHHLVTLASVTGDTEAMAMLANDWVAFGRGSDFVLSKRIMKYFSRHGNVAMTEKVLDAYLKSAEKLPSAKFFGPLLQAYAVQGNPQAVEKSIQWIEEITMIKAEIVSWNILLYAYAKIHDLDGVLTTLARLTKEPDLKPDSITMGTVIAACAAKGQTELVELLLVYTDKHRIDRTLSMDMASARTHIRNREFKKAEAVIKAVSNSMPLEQQTKLWTEVLVGYVLQRSVYDAHRVASSMKDCNIPFDALSYAAIMRLFIFNNQGVRAEAMLMRMEEESKLQATAFHYAILIDGYTQHGKYERAMRMHAKMVERGIRPTASSQVALLKLHAYAADSKAAKDVVVHPGLRFDIAEELIEQLITEYNPYSSDYTGPEIGLLGSPIASSLPTILFDVLLKVYGSSRAFETIKALFNRFQGAGLLSHSGSTHAKLSVLLSIMEMRRKQGDESDVYHCWVYAKQIALNLADANIKSTAPNESTPGQIPYQFQTVLARHFDSFIRSLRVSPDELDKHVRDYQQLGFVLDYRNWNQFLRMLIQYNLYEEAFRFCEKELIKTFPGWNTHRKAPKSSLRSGFKPAGMYMIGMSFSVNDSRQKLVQYPTLFELRRVLKSLDKKAAVGDSEAQNQLFEINRIAPKTLYTLQSMPSPKPLRFAPEKRTTLGEPYEESSREAAQRSFDDTYEALRQ
ncbi:MAG: hypothetical protein M1828_003200 [Chrysothrix sp. TS-e1954]|nr:MAG: hypothetical protein M1828_003200 [Chrysothrix sp. TS-e1954]